MQDRVFYSLCFGFLMGVAIRSLFFVGLYFIVLFSLISFCIALVVALGYNKWLLILCLFLFALSLGLMRFAFSDIAPPVLLERQVGKSVSLEGLVVQQPENRENNKKVLVEIQDDTRVSVSVPLDEYINYGDWVSLSGVLEKPENFDTDQGKVFDYVNYLRKDNIFYTMRYAEVTVLSSNNGNFIKKALFQLKEKFINKINYAISSPESLLMNGLILGERSAFDADLREAFIDTGTIHIVALSGYNVTIVAEWIMKSFVFLPSWASIWAGIITIILFVLMTGSNSTAIRAGVMAILVLIARYTGRNYDVARALVLAGALMVLFNPLILIYDVSFQLSFIATIAVIFLTPKIQKYFLWCTERFGLRDILSVTFAAYVFVLPFIIYKMGNLSLVAIPANVLILPFIPFTMLLGFVTGVAGFIGGIISLPFGFITQIFLGYELGVIEALAKMPFASLAIPEFPLLVTLLIYAYFFYKLFWRVIVKFFSDTF